MYVFSVQEVSRSVGLSVKGIRVSRKTILGSGSLRRVWSLGDQQGRLQGLASSVPRGKWIFLVVGAQRQTQINRVDESVIGVPWQTAAFMMSTFRWCAAARFSLESRPTPSWWQNKGARTLHCLCPAPWHAQMHLTPCAQKQHVEVFPLQLYSATVCE